MDSSSWIHGNGGGGSGFMCGYAAREQQREPFFSSEIRQHLNKINMEMNMDDDEPAAYTNSYHATGDCGFPSSSSVSSFFRSASFSCSSTAEHVVMAPPNGLQFPEVSSLVAPGGGANFHDMPCGMSSTSAFRRYERQLGPQRRLTKPACGQRMFKTAMSVLAKMHTAMRYSHHHQQAGAAAETSGGHQLQHMITERKRREKLNESFHALKTVIPPVSKKLGRTAILIIAREYVNSLKSKVCELEEKNQALQSELARRDTSAAEDGAGEKVKIQITRTASAEDNQTEDVCIVKIATPPRRGNMTDVVPRILQRLKDQMGEDISLLSMSTGEDGDGPHRASVTLHLKWASGTKWEEEAIREAITKAMTLSIAGRSGRCSEVVDHVR